MFIGCALCIFSSIVLFSINSQEVFEVEATDFYAGTAVTHRKTRDLLSTVHTPL
jgi:hypothetical protein